MKLIPKFSAFILMIWIVIFISCKKEYSYEGCGEKNKPPIAKAGLDQVITLPSDSVLLDGNSSGDPNGKISEWLWTKISGPALFNIIKTSDSITKVKALAVGTYQFELKVTDNCGLFAKDTVRIIVDSRSTNHPPVANAGVDQTITLPNNTVNLDGSGSTDPDNNISSYLWTKISGPSSFNILNIIAAQTQVNNLVEGAYQFELKVIDAGGLFSKDTAQIIVNTTQSDPCLGNRPFINAQLIPLGVLSQTREYISVASAGNKILFAGGYLDTGIPSTTRVDIYDITTNSWSTTELSQGHYLGGKAVLGNKIFFAGGIVYNVSSQLPTSRIDIYDVSTNIWSTAELSKARSHLQAASAGNKVLFAGSCFGCGANELSGAVDIYDATSGSWSATVLSFPRQVGSATKIGNKIFFAGGGYLDTNEELVASSRIDIYDAVSNSWSLAELSQPRRAQGGISIGNKNYWAGGWDNTVEIRDATTQNQSFSCLFQPNGWKYSSTENAVVEKNNKLIFFTGGGAVKNKFDIYDVTTNTWSIGVLPVNIEMASIISVNNTIYVAGGIVNGVLSNQVWKLEF